MSRKQMPGVFAQLVCLVLAFVLTAALIASAGAWLVSGLTSDHALYAAAMRDNSAASQERFGRRITAMAAQYHFSEDTVLAHVTEEDWAAVRKDMGGWLSAVLRTGEGLALPVTELPEVTEALKQDALLIETEGEARAQTLAEGKLTESVVTALQQSVLPVRGSLIRLGLRQVSSRFDLARYAALLPYAAGLGALAALVLCALIVLLCARRPVRSALFIGSALIAAALVMAFAAAAVWRMQPLAAIGSVSALFAALISGVGTQLAIRCGVLAGGMLVIGLCLMITHQAVMAGMRRRAS